MTNVLITAAVVAALVIGVGIIRLRRLSLGTLIFVLIGAILGLLFGALTSVPLSKLPAPFGEVLPILISVVLVLIFIPLALAQRRTVRHHFPALRQIESGDSQSGQPSILVDTSAIIDGRIADIAVAGFVPGRLLVPKFVLAELQNIADSEEPMRRGRGRRGLEVLTNLQETLGDGVEIIAHDVPGIKEVDAKLVALGVQLKASILTTDYNLNRVAQIQSVRVLNVNELSNAVRPVVIPGEQLQVRIVQAGKERHQGVGYLADGTMIVVENGDKLIGQEVPTEVTRVFQTVAGKMIFATPRGETKPSGRGRKRPEPAPDLVDEAAIESPAPVTETSGAAIQPEVPKPTPAPRRPEVAKSSHDHPKPNHGDDKTHHEAKPGQPRRSGGNRRRVSPEDALIREINKQSE